MYCVSPFLSIENFTCNPKLTFTLFNFWISFSTKSVNFDFISLANDKKDFLIHPFSKHEAILGNYFGIIETRHIIQHDLVVRLRKVSVFLILYWVVKHLQNNIYSADISSKENIGTSAH